MPFSVTLRCSPDDADLLLGESTEFETTGIEHLEDGLRVHFASRSEAQRFRDRCAGCTAELAEIEDRNWAEEWQRLWHPMEVGRRFYLKPPWIQGGAPEGRLLLEMRPGLVFGGGDHATTQLCLELMEEHLRPGDSMADIGCGSGILTDAAHALGAGRLIACDIDANAAEAAARILSDHGRSGLSYQGSISALRAASADVVAANLLTGVVVGLLPEFARVLKPGGLLIASGYLDSQAELVAEKARACGFALLEQRTKADWAAGAFQRTTLAK